MRFFVFCIVFFVCNVHAEYFEIRDCYDVERVRNNVRIFWGENSSLIEKIIDSEESLSEREKKELLESSHYLVKPIVRDFINNPYLVSKNLLKSVQYITENEKDLLPKLGEDAFYSLYGGLVALQNLINKL